MFFKHEEQATGPRIGRWSRAYLKSAVMAQEPAGLLYQPDFISAAQERLLVAEIERLTFSEVRMHGITAKRRVAHFGWIYGFESWKITAGAPIPEFIASLRAHVATLADLAPECFAAVLVTEYPPDAGIGWHHDAPLFGESVIGVSLLSSCRLRFERGKGEQREICELALEPRSVYVLSGAARHTWRHSIPAGKQLRYSITLRTLRHPTA